MHRCELLGMKGTRQKRRDKVFCWRKKRKVDNGKWKEIMQKKDHWQCIRSINGILDLAMIALMVIFFMSQLT